MQYIQNGVRKPIVISILVILNAIVGVGSIYLLGALLLVAIGVLHTKSALDFESYFTIIFGLVMGVTAWGLWGYKRWAYWIEILFILFDIGNKFSEVITDTSTIFTLIAMIVDICVIAYLLFSPRMREIFLKRHSYHGVSI